MLDIPGVITDALLSVTENVHVDGVSNWDWYASTSGVRGLLPLMTEFTDTPLHLPN